MYGHLMSKSVLASIIRFKHSLKVQKILYLLLYYRTQIISYRQNICIQAFNIAPSPGGTSSSIQIEHSIEYFVCKRGICSTISVAPSWHSPLLTSSSMAFNLCAQPYLLSASSILKLGWGCFLFLEGSFGSFEMRLRYLLYVFSDTIWNPIKLTYVD